MRTTISNACIYFTVLFSTLQLTAIEQTIPEAQNYQFVGRHFLASYYGCDEKALNNIDGLRSSMEQGVRASGATLLDGAEFAFSPNGFTMVLLLSESHASIHTYPEHGACFIDFFTCGTSCVAEEFDRVLRAFLKPAKAETQFFTRK